jgi:hypothetical protein
MKVETDTYTKIMLLIVVVCLLAITYKYLKTGGTTRVQAAVSLAPLSVAVAPISFAPTAPTTLAPRNPAGFMAKA